MTRSMFTAARLAFANLLASMVYVPSVKRHQYWLAMCAPRVQRIPGQPNPAGTKIARQASANAIGLRGRVSND